MNLGLKNSIIRELKRLCSRPVYLVMMVVVPIGCALFFISLLNSGLPVRTPVAIVDLDHSQLSREVARSLNATQLVDIQEEAESYKSAMKAVREGKIYGFFFIPEDFERDALGGRTPTLEFFSNMTYFVPGTLSFKGFKTIAVSTTGGIAKSKMAFIGLTPNQIAALAQPVVINTHGIGNPWLNYSYYLTPSFTYATLALLFMLFTAYTITVEIKHDTSRQWLATAKDRMSIALVGKLLPQTVIFMLVTLAVSVLMFKYNHFPMNGSFASLLGALALFVLASQAFAVFICSILPNPRWALSVLSLLSVLSFSFVGFSFPVESMYGAIGIFSYIMPVRYLFLIYVNTALNGFPIYYVRDCYIALILFVPIGYVLIGRLRKACLDPVYIP